MFVGQGRSFPFTDGQDGLVIEDVRDYQQSRQSAT